MALTQQERKIVTTQNEVLASIAELDRKITSCQERISSAQRIVSAIKEEKTRIGALDHKIRETRRTLSTMLSEYGLLSYELYKKSSIISPTLEKIFRSLRQPDDASSTHKKLGNIYTRVLAESKILMRSHHARLVGEQIMGTSFAQQTSDEKLQSLHKHILARHVSMKRYRNKKNLHEQSLARLNIERASQASFFEARKLQKELQLYRSQRSACYREFFSRNTTIPSAKLKKLIREFTEKQ